MANLIIGGKLKKNKAVKMIITKEKKETCVSESWQVC